MQTFAVLGAGAWGTALACHLAARPGHAVRLWAARAASADDLLTHRENRRQLPGVPIPESVRESANLSVASASPNISLPSLIAVYLNRMFIFSSCHKCLVRNCL